MSHLAPDRLAALADDEPNTTEAAHLAACAICARERGAYLSLRRLATDARAAVAPPLLEWDLLSERLRDAGRLRSPHSRRWSWVGRYGLQTAAALLLTAGGVAVGRWSARGDLTGSGSADRLASSGVRAERAGTGDTLVEFASVEDALATLSRAERDYRLASAFLATRDTAGSLGGSTLYRTRLAALDAMAEVAREAVGEAPHDPVVNQYYLSTLGAREATLRQIGRTLPAGVRLTGF